MTKRLTSVTVEYDDGSSKQHDITSAEDYSVVLDALRTEWSGWDMVQQKKHVVVEWKDGWKEVFAVPNGSGSVRKYSIIERVESVGRLYLDTVLGYPELIELYRKPHDVDKVTLI